MWARMLNILIGTWLLVSAFALGMRGFVFGATVVLGIAVVAIEAFSFWRRDARYGTAIAGGLVLATAFGAAFTPTALAAGRDIAFWNNFFCGVALVVLSVGFRVPVSRRRWTPHPDRPERPIGSRRAEV